MATVERSIGVEASDTRLKSKARPKGSVRFDLWVALLSTWFVIGMFIDGWAHNHGRVDDTFFTIYHAVLYSGYGAVGVLLVWTQFRNVNKGYAWSGALPIGYMTALLGIIFFGMAGVADLVWHETFGFEEDLEALISPSHLALATGAFLFLTGPIRAAWGRKDNATWRELFPVLLSVSLVFSLLTFFTMFSNLFDSPLMLVGRRPREYWTIDTYGINSILISAGIMMGILLFTMRRWKLPIGAFTFILTLNTAFMFFVWLPDQSEIGWLLLSAPIAGLVADTFYTRFRPSQQNPIGLRLFSFIVPFVYFLSFLILLNIVGEQITTSGLWWKIHMWLGTPFMAGMIGIFISYISVPPNIGIEEMSA